MGFFYNTPERRKMIANLTQHPASAEQEHAGVVDLPPAQQEKLRELLTFAELPSAEDVKARAEALASLTRASAAMIGGAPYLMAPLETALRERGIKPLYAFSRRESVEQVQADGSVRKVAVFRHVNIRQLKQTAFEPT